MIGQHNIARGLLLQCPPAPLSWRNSFGLQSAYTCLVHSTGGNHSKLQVALKQVHPEPLFTRIEPRYGFDCQRLSLAHEARIEIEYPLPDLDRRGDLEWDIQLFASSFLNPRDIVCEITPLIDAMYAHANLLRQNNSFRRHDVTR